MPLTCCRSAGTRPVREMPSLPFPEMPVADGMEVSEDGRKVTVDADWIVRLAEFRIKYDLLREEYGKMTAGAQKDGGEKTGGKP